MPDTHRKAMARKSEMHEKIAAQSGDSNTSPFRMAGVLQAIMRKHGLTQEEAEQAIRYFGG